MFAKTSYAGVEELIELIMRPAKAMPKPGRVNFLGSSEFTIL